MSLLGKKWIIKNNNPHKNVIEKVLENRGYDELKELEHLHDPFMFKGMEIAVKRIDEAIKNKDRIIVFGDYDVDGISGTAIMVSVLKKLNANVSYRLPNRTSDGYGLSEKFIDEFIEKKIDLIITVDCGVSCANEIDKAKKHGIDVIITDHHTIPKNIPTSVVCILHPKLENSEYPYRELTGAGVSLKLAEALIYTYFKKADHSYLDELINLASLGTIADLGPLNGENRLIVKKGLENLMKTKSKGLKKIIDLSLTKDKETLDSYTIGFRIAPRINAAGRIGDPYIALSLLLENDDETKINFLGNSLDDLNRQRQDMTERAMMEAETHILESKKMPYILIAESTEWHVGILGLVAGKLTEKYGLPSVIMQDLGENLVGSARSPKVFNITEALSSCSNLLINFGGHSQAAGFTVKKENLQQFKKAISSYAESNLKKVDLKPVIEIDCELTSQDIGTDLFEEIERLAPFGIGNEKPKFIVNGVTPFFINTVGHNNNHLKLTAKIGDKDISAIAFQMGSFSDEVRKHKKIDMVCHLEKNIWNNRETLNLHVLDIRVSEDESE